MNTILNASTLSDSLLDIEQLREDFQRSLQETYLIDFRVQLTVHPEGEPLAQELVDAARELGWQYDEMPVDRTTPFCYDQIYLSHRAADGITLYGPDRPRVAK